MNQTGANEEAVDWWKIYIFWREIFFRLRNVGSIGFN